MTKEDYQQPDYRKHVATTTTATNVPQPTPPTPAGAGTETPETDAAYGGFDCLSPLILDHARKLEQQRDSLRHQAEADREELNQVLTGNEPGNIPWLHEQKDKLLRAVMHLTAQLASADKDRERLRTALEGVLNSAVHPDIALRAVMVDLIPVREALEPQPSPSIDQGGTGAKQP